MALNRSPHTRGDGPRIRLVREMFEVFSPHAWGWSELLALLSAASIVLPTRVGMVRIRAFMLLSEHQKGWLKPDNYKEARSREEKGRAVEVSRVTTLF